MSATKNIEINRNSDAYNTGYEAAKKGEPRSANPYCRGTIDAANWLAGWIDEAPQGDCSEDEADEWFRKVANAIASPEGQAFLRELADALDALRDKVLIDGELIDERGDCCAIGAVCKSRGIDVEELDNDPECVAEELGAPLPLVAEVVDLNDAYHYETPDIRWERMREWVDTRIRKDGGA